MPEHVLHFYSGKLLQIHSGVDNPLPGTRLIREWDGVQHTVTVLREGYEWEGRTYRSLSAVARTITGVHWNGFRFFALNGLRRKD